MTDENIEDIESGDILLMAVVLKRNGNVGLMIKRKQISFLPEEALNAIKMRVAVEVEQAKLDGPENIKKFEEVLNGSKKSDKRSKRKTS
jgi:hypothetical protein